MCGPPLRATTEGRLCKKMLLFDRAPGRKTPRKLGMTGKASFGRRNACVPSVAAPGMQVNVTGHAKGRVLSHPAFRNDEARLGQSR